MWAHNTNLELRSLLKFKECRYCFLNKDIHKNITIGVIATTCLIFAVPVTYVVQNYFD